MAGRIVPAKSVALEKIVEDPPKLDYATPKEDSSLPPVTPSGRVIAIMGVIVYGLLTLFFLFIAIEWIFDGDSRGSLIPLLIFIFSAWRLWMAFEDAFVAPRKS